MKRIYHKLVDRWGEPNDLVVFDRENAAIPGALETTHVAIWDSDAECDVTTFFTLGMSELPMTEADYRAEVTLGCRDPLGASDRSKIPTFMANVAAYPFSHDLRLDWWERISNAGAIPAFPGCSQVLIAPDLGEGDFEWFPEPDDDVKILRLIPITPGEAHVLEAHGRSSFLDYWEQSGVDIFAPRSDPLNGRVDSLQKSR